jgi:DNA sulfur modification protein DndB
MISKPENRNVSTKSRDLADSFYYVFSAISGVQAGREYYVAMCPLKLIPKIFLFDEDEIPPEVRAQRALNHARVPEIARYIVDNPTQYVFSSLTASVDGEVRFEPLEEGNQFLGKLMIPMTAQFIINDGQHRRAAIEEALKQRPELGDETISVVFFVDSELRRSQQMFADLNKHAIRPTKSIGILYDLRDPLSELARQLISSIDCFRGLTETERTTISNRSTKLFTLSGIYQGTQSLLRKQKHAKISAPEAALAQDFWKEIQKYMPEWQLAQQRKIAPAELRRDYIHAHGLALHALGLAGAALIAEFPQNWKEHLPRLKKIDWARSNTALWEGRATMGGRVSKAHSNVLLTASFIKKTLAVELTSEESRLEESLKKRGA